MFKINKLWHAFILDFPSVTNSFTIGLNKRLEEHEALRNWTTNKA